MRCTRRSFLAGAATGALACNGDAPVGPRAVHRVGRPGIQLYTVRNELARDPRGTLARLAEIGYRDVETAGSYGPGPERFRTWLDETGLEAPSGHFPLDAFEGPEPWNAARIVRHEYLTVSSPGTPAPMTVADWKKVAVLVSRAALTAAQRRVKIAYHNHASELAPVGGTTGLEILLAETDFTYVDFEMDIFWVVKGGGDPRALMERHSNRFHLFHVKDSSGPPAHEIVDPGAGTIDFASILDRRATDADKFFVEHDDPKDPFATAAAGYRYLSGLRF